MSTKRGQPQTATIPVGERPKGDEDWKQVGPVRLAPEGAEVTIGRLATAAVRLDQPWISNQQMIVRCVGPVWHVENGARHPMRVHSVAPDGRHLVTAEVIPGGHLYLGEGTHRVSWPKLRRGLIVTLRISSCFSMEELALPRRLDRKLARPPRYVRSLRPLLLRRAGVLSERERRHRLAVIFAHLLDPNVPKPRNVYAAAEARFKDDGVHLSADTLKKFVKDSWENVDVDRGTAFHVHEFGALLVELGQIGKEDLTRPQAPRGNHRRSR